MKPTLELAQRVHQQTGIPMGEIKLALGLPLSSVTTLEEVWEVYEAAPRGSKAQEAAFAKWNKLALEKVQAAATLGEARKAYEAAPRDSKARKMALKKWIEFCSTPKEVLEVYWAAPWDSKVQKAAIRKICELLS